MLNAQENLNLLSPGEGSPILISAGVLKEKGQLEDFLRIEDPLMAPTLTLGSYTLEQWDGNGAADSIRYPYLGLFGNARGLPNQGIEAAVQELQGPISELSRIGLRTIVSVTNLPQETPLEVIPELVERTVEGLNPTAVEINFSCPNGKKADGTLHQPLCTDADASGEVLERTRERVGDDVYLLAKDSPHATTIEGPSNFAEVSSFLVAVGRFVNGVTSINTVGNQLFPEITVANGRGGASGPAVAPLAKNYLKFAVGVLPDNVTVLSVGGVETSNAASEIPERRALGALLVGGAQEFYRSRRPLDVAIRWAQEAA